MRLQRFSYTATQFKAEQFTNVEQALPFKQLNGITWLDLDGRLSEADLSLLAKTLDLHPLEVEGFIRKRQRPRIDYFTTHVTTSLKMLRVGSKEHLFQSESVTVIVGSNYVVTIQSGKIGDVFSSIRDELTNPQSRLRTLGSDYLLYRLLASVVNNYFLVLEKIDEQVEQLEDALVEQADNTALHDLYRVKRELVILRKAVWPLREVILSVERTPTTLIQAETQIYFRDIYEQTIQVIDTVESLRDLMSGMIEIYLSSLNNRMNSIIKVLTIITTIFMPLNLIVGIFGMNFQYLPGLDSPIGPWEVLGAMLFSTIAMIVAFKYKKWL